MIRIVASNIFFRTIAIVSQVLILIITNRLVMAEGRGILASSITWANTFFTFFFCSLNIVLFNSINECPAEKDNYQKGVYNISFLLAVAAVVFSFAVYFLLPGIFRNIPVPVLFVSFLTVPFILLQNNLWAIFQARHQFNYFNFAIIISPVVNLLLSILLILLDRYTVLTGCIATCISWVAGTIYCLIKIGLLLDLRSIKIFNNKKILSKILFAHLATIITFIINRTDILFLNYYTDNRSTGFYFMASAMVGYLLIIPMSIQSILYSKLIGLSEQEEKKMITTYSRLSFGIMTLSCIFIELFADQIIWILGGRSFAVSAYFLRILTPCAIIYSVPVIWASLWVAKGYFNKLTNISFATIVINLAMNFILVPKYGAKGAAATFITCCIFIFALHFLLIRNYYKGENPFKKLFPQQTDYINIYNKAVDFLKSSRA